MLLMWAVSAAISSYFIRLGEILEDCSNSRRQLGLSIVGVGISINKGNDGWSIK